MCSVFVGNPKHLMTRRAKAVWDALHKSEKDPLAYPSFESHYTKVRNCQV